MVMPQPEFDHADKGGAFYGKLFLLSEDFKYK